MTRLANAIDAARWRLVRLLIGDRPLLANVEFVGGVVIRTRGAGLYYRVRYNSVTELSEP